MHIWFNVYGWLAIEGALDEGSREVSGRLCGGDLAAVDVVDVGCDHYHHVFWVASLNGRVSTGVS